MKYNYQKIALERPVIEKLSVLSFETSLYLVRLQIAGQQGLVYGDHDHPERYKSSQAIREAFADFQVIQAELIHDSPYDEMIGNPAKSNQPMILPFSLTLPY